MSRAVVTNRYPSLGALASFFGLPADKNQLHRSDLRRLATGEVDLQLLADFTEHSVDAIQKATVRIGPPSPGGHWDEYVSVHSWRYCPECLLAGKSHQRQWLIAFSTACVEHHCTLVDSCHRCHATYDMRSVMTTYCSHCQLPPQVEAAHANEIECSERIARTINDPAALKAFLDRLMSAWYSGTSSALRPHFRFSPQRRLVAELRQIVIRALPASRDDQCLADAIGLQNARLASRWPQFTDVAGLLNSRALDAGATLPPAGHLEAGQELVPASDPWMVPLHVAAAAAGVSTFILRGIARAQLVQSQLFADLDEDGRRHEFRMVALDDVHALVADLYAMAQPEGDAVRLVGLTTLGVPEVIQDVQMGRMSIFRGSGTTLSDLKVQFSASSRFKRSQRRPGDAMLAKEACSLLGTYHAVVADLAATGRLALHGKSRPNRLLLSRDSVEAFNQEFVVVGALAHQLDANPTNLADKLTALGVDPVPMGTLVNIYKRDEIVNVDLKAVIGMQNYASRAGRKSTVSSDKVSGARVKRLIELVKSHHGATKFSRHFGVSEGNLSMMMREQKPFGRLAARRMEARCGLPEGWFG